MTTIHRTPYDIQKAFDNFLDINWGVIETTAVRKTSNPAPALPYIEGHVIFGDVFAIETMGAAERVGVFIINIFTRTDAGDLEGYAYGGQIEALFWHEKIDNIWCENGDLLPSTRKIGKDNDRQAFHFQTTIPFSVLME